MIHPFLASLFFAAVAVADAPVKAPPLAGVRLPVVEEPAPRPGPLAVAKLNAGRLYIIDSDIELTVVASRDGFVEVVPESGPLRIRGVFVDTPDGKPTTRTFKGPFLYSVEVVASGRVELLLFKDHKSPVIRRTLEVDAGEGPRPPPDPPPPPAVDPPIPGPGLKVLIVYESGAIIPAAQGSVLDGKTVRDYLESNCPVGPDGKTKEYRIWDRDADPAGESALWQAAFKRPRTSVPWCVVSDGKSKAGSYEGPLPASAADFITVLKKAGGH